jgi:hypothetical protein
MDSVSPVWTDEEVHSECVVALDQPEYVPIVILPIVYSDGVVGMSVRFRLSDEERKTIADGGDLVITELTSLENRRFTPIKVQVCMPNERP